MKNVVLLLEYYIVVSVNVMMNMRNMIVGSFIFFIFFVRRKNENLDLVEFVGYYYYCGVWELVYWCWKDIVNFIYYCGFWVVGEGVGDESVEWSFDEVVYFWYYVESVNDVCDDCNF